MKFKRRPDWMILILGIVIIMLSTEAVIGDRPLLALCQRDCSINVMLRLIFGETNGRIVFGIIGYLFACLCFVWAFRERKNEKESKESKRNKGLG